MSTIDGSQIAAAALYVLTSATWATIGYGYSRLISASRGDRLRGDWVLSVWASALVSLRYLLGAILYLLPRELFERSPGWLLRLWDAHEISLVIAAAGFLDLVKPTAEDRMRWRAWNYGIAALVCMLAVGVHASFPGPRWERAEASSSVVWTYVLVVAVLVLREARKTARPGSWQPYRLRGLLNRDLGLLAGALSLALLAPLMIAGRWDWLLLKSAATSLPALAFALVLAMPALGWFVLRIAVVCLALLASGSIYLASEALGASLGTELAGVRALATILAIPVIVPVVQSSRRALDRLMLKRSQDRAQGLVRFVTTLAPDIGIRACCERFTTELLRAMPHYTGAAILLDGGGAIRAGAIAIERIEAVWPRNSRDEEERLVSLFERLAIDEMPPEVARGLGDANVVSITPVRSPGRLWGHLFLRTGLLGTSGAAEDHDTLRTLTGQLALVLEGADLLTRAVAVESALSHASRLAEIGESAARVAHEIRNPVAAARSLAQQLATDPDGTAREEHQIILGELDRIESQISGLLRYARKDEMRREVVELGALAREAMAALRGRLDEVGVRGDVDAPDEVTVSADREQIRQVLVNLLQNSLEASHERAGERWVRVEISRRDGTASIRVHDNGPGLAPADADRIFQPFFTRKERGTGLGLAMARKTIENHGGCIEVEAGAAQGCTIRIRLPAT